MAEKKAMELENFNTANEADGFNADEVKKGKEMVSKLLHDFSEQNLKEMSDADLLGFLSDCLKKKSTMEKNPYLKSVLAGNQ